MVDDTVQNNEESNLIHSNFDKIETSRDFFKWYAKIEEDLDGENNIYSTEYFEKLSIQKENLFGLLNEVISLKDLNNLFVLLVDLLSILGRFCFGGYVQNNNVV